MDDFEARRLRMVQSQIADRGVRDPRLLDALRSVPRECFVGESMVERAYDDAPLPIDAGQTISQPLIVAEMIEAAGVDAGARVLEIGVGSGYVVALLSLLAARVFGIERHEVLALSARQRLQALGYRHVELRSGDGSIGWPAAAPFDAIIVSAASPQVPAALQQQLAIGGRLVIPVGDSDSQRLLLLTRTAVDRFDQQVLGAVAFVPLIGEQGWSG